MITPARRETPTGGCVGHDRRERRQAAFPVLYFRFADGAKWRENARIRRNERAGND